MSRRFVRPLPNVEERPGTVLVCEDSDELRALLIGRLARQRGLEVVGEVADGEAALEAVLRLRPDSLLLDLMLDDTDPNEMLQALAVVDGRPLVIVFSGVEPGTLERESRAVVDVYLDKTTPLGTVAEVVAKTIASHRASERI